MFGNIAARLALAAVTIFLAEMRGSAIMTLLWWAIIALIIAVVAGALGFTGVAAGAAVIARVLFALFLIAAIILFALVIFGVGAAAT